jgi:hypothetical protein
MTGTIVAIWNRTDLDALVELLVDRLVYSHGTARAFPAAGYWFDSNNSSNTFEQTLQDITNRGSDDFVHPSIRTGLTGRLYEVIDGLDDVTTRLLGHFFCKALDELSERSRVSEDFESAATDQGRFVYLVCLPSAIIDRFNFTSDEGSLNGLRTALAALLGQDAAMELAKPFYMIKKLRKQYPIHEEYSVSAAGIRTRRRDVEVAEAYFGLRNDADFDWSAVRRAFLEALEALKGALESVPAAPTTGTP